MKCSFVLEHRMANTMPSQLLKPVAVFRKQSIAKFLHALAATVVWASMVSRPQKPSLLMGGKKKGGWPRP
jgi:hypothetical protein